jgi:hypothetical protein
VGFIGGSITYVKGQMRRNEEEQRKKGYYVPVDRSGGGI